MRGRIGNPGQNRNVPNAVRLTLAANMPLALPGRLRRADDAKSEDRPDTMDCSRADGGAVALLGI